MTGVQTCALPICGLEKDGAPVGGINFVMLHNAKVITKLVKESKLKVQAQIQGDQVRIIGKKRDDLQEAIALLKQAEVKVPLQFTNFRD